MDAVKKDLLNKSNAEFTLIAGLFAEAGSILLFPHTNMDGDAFGSSAALCRVLRKLGKKAYILLEDEIPGYLKFLDENFCVKMEQGEEVQQVTERIFGNEEIDLCVCIDCGDTGRFELRKEVFVQGKTSVCLDHHRSSETFADYNYIDSDIAATGEIIYMLIKALEEVTGEKLVDKSVGEAIYTAIVTDTGSFRYSNTTKGTHGIVMELFDVGIDCNKVSVEVFQNSRIEKILLHSAILSNLRLFAGGKGAVAYVTQQMLEDARATMDETDGIVETLRSISGVEVALFLKEGTDNTVKASMRAKSYADVCAIAENFGGGGHIRAAGCTLHTSIAEAVDILTAAIGKALI